MLYSFADERLNFTVGNPVPPFSTELQARTGDSAYNMSFDGQSSLHGKYCFASLLLQAVRGTSSTETLLLARRCLHVYAGCWQLTGGLALPC